MKVEKGDVDRDMRRKLEVVPGEAGDFGRIGPVKREAIRSMFPGGESFV